jgi:hypothetical protein
MSRTVKLYVAYVKLEWDEEIKWIRTVSHPDRDRVMELVETLAKLFPIDEVRVELEEKEI